MTKHEYMSILKNKLEGFDEEVVNEIILDYEEHFNLGYAQRKNDQEIIDSLGDIDELVNEMEQCYKRHQTNSVNFDFSNLNSFIKNTIKDVGKIVKEELKDVDVKFGYNFENTSNNNDEDLHYQRFTFSDTFKKIVVDNFYGEIEIRESDELSVDYECDGSKKDILMYPLATETIDDELIITVSQPTTYGHVINRTPDMRLFLNVPSWVESIQIMNCDDTISMEELAINNFLCDVKSADIEIREAQIGNCSLKTVSGNMCIDNCTINALNIDTVSGDMEIIDHTLGKATIVSVSGDIELIEGTSRMIEVHTTSGDIEVNSSGCEAYSIISTSGDIDVTIDGEAALQLECKSGNIDIELLDSVNGFIAATKAISGDITIEFDDFNRDELPSGIYQYSRNNNDMEVKMKIETISGDIYIHE